MPVTAGPVPGLTSGLHRVRMDPGRFRSGRWWLLADGVLVSAFGIAVVVSAALHPHAGPTGAPVLGLALTPAHGAILLALGLLAIAAVGSRRAAVSVTALSAVAYTLLLFFRPTDVADSRRVGRRSLGAAAETGPGATVVLDLRSGPRVSDRSPERGFGDGAESTAPGNPARVGDPTGRRSPLISQSVSAVPTPSK